MSDQFCIKKSLFVMFAGLFLGVSAGIVGDRRSEFERRLGMSKMGSMVHNKPSHGPARSGTMGRQRTRLNNIFASSTEQTINAANINNAQVQADEINGFVFIGQNGPLSVQNSEKKFRTTNAALDIEVNQTPAPVRRAERPKTTSPRIGSRSGGATRPASERTQINNVDVSRTQQDINVFNINNAQVQADDDINGIVVIEQNGPVSIQNSEQKFRSENLAAKLQANDIFRRR